MLAGPRAALKPGAVLRLGAAARLGAPVLLAALLGGCTVGPNFIPPKLFSPASWFSGRPPPPPQLESRTVPEPLDPNWWTVFNDPVLTGLVQQVAASNLDVRTATIRIAEARQERAIAASSALPDLNGNGSYTRERASKNGVLSLASGGGSSTTQTGSNGAGQGNAANGTGFGVVPIPGSSGSSPFDIYQYGFDASWELDLWGKVRRSVESADASVEQSAENRRDVLLSNIAEVARDYLQLRGVQTTLAITRENLGTQQQSLQLTQQRFAGGLTSDLDVANAAAQVATTQAQLPQLETTEASDINALSFLLGEPPGALRQALQTPKPVPPVPPTVPIGLPSELARRRPDIREAEDQLHSATADIGVAVASFYPSLTLSGSVSLQALQFKDLNNISSTQYALGPTLSLPIFQGGQLRGTLELRRAQQQEAATNYEKTVLQALHDVDNALTAYQDEQQRRDLLQQAVAQNQKAVGLAQSRYAQGIDDFLTVLDAQRNLLQAQQQLSESTTNVSTDLVQLYKALGGGWESAYPRNPGETASSRM
jgi:NodT family efflux transporter outer membrane factor (OMF) lipoprotein